ncbi:16S rRNA (uracil(1498)-N(3))-methyltransferase [Acinetobacter sp. HY1485]|uniref:16S rRNA (uracil(1498)-N(3))-methyltransferase n=1 Tax=Acinetobacter sp. HY1485 TaxID=2970918 RepID=UPI0022B9A4C9|nr:16S rRNA (uracil(1498)-N(3))-methyltransferase [Acinetobacter sp. HY1485]
MNIVLLEPQSVLDIWSITEERQLVHLHTHLKVQVGDTLKVGFKNAKRYLVKVVHVEPHLIQVEPLYEESVPNKLPIHLVVALPRPKVLRRLIMDSVSMGVNRISLIHSYRVDKSYWQSPFLNQLDEYITLGLEQAGDTVFPDIQFYKRFKPFVEDVLSTFEQPSYVAHPYATMTMPRHMSEPCTVVIGPEGGFIDYEIELLKQNGCQAVTLGDRILRTETAISYVLGRLG